MIELSGMENRDALLKEVADRAYQELLNETSPNEEKAKTLDLKRKSEAYEMKRHLQDRKRQKVFRIRRSMKLNDTIGFLLALFGVFLAFNENEDNFNDVNSSKNKSSSTGQSMRVLILISTLFLVLTSVRHHYFQYVISRENQSYTAKVGNKFYKSVQFLYMLFEVCVVSVHSPPGYDRTIEFEQLDGTLVLSVNNVLTSLMLLRAFLILRVVWHFSRMSAEKATQFCGEVGCEANTMFVFKALFKEKPFIMLSCGMFVSIFIFALAVRVYERPYKVNEELGLNYNYVWNSMWLVVLTMTTVGYGDIYPNTHIGRFIIVIACFWGVFLVSMMVVTLNDTSKFSPAEKRSYDMLTKLKAKEQAYRAASKLVAVCLQYMVFKRKFRLSENFQEMRLTKHNELMNALRAFKFLRSQWKTFEYTDEEKLRQLSEQIELDLEGLKQQVGGLSNIDNELKRIEDHLETSAKSTRVALLHIDELMVQLEKVEQSLA